MIVGPWTHGEHVNESTLQAIRLEWFDTWLKNAPTGMAATSKPLHLFENGANTWIDSSAWPLSLDARTYYLGNGSLTATKPTGQGSDSLSWGAATAANTLTYTTAPLTGTALLNGPADVTIYARSTTVETELTATLNIVAPDGTVTKQADGILLGSQRAVDADESWYGKNKALLKPCHPFTQASQQPVTPGRTTRYDISLLPNFTRIPAGYRIQITVNSRPPADFHFPVAPTPQQLADLTGGLYTVERSRGSGFVRQPSADVSRCGDPQRGQLGAGVLTVRVVRVSERVEAGLEQAELIAFGVGQDMPLLLPRLADVGRAGTELQQAFELGVLIAVGGVDVDVQPGLPLLRLIPATEDDRRLRTTEPFARPDLQRAVVLAIEHDEVQDLAPEPRQHLGVAATEHELTDTTCHKETCSQPRIRRGGHKRSSWAPTSENNPATVPDEVSPGEMFSGRLASVQQIGLFRGDLVPQRAELEPARKCAGDL